MMSNDTNTKGTTMKNETMTLRNGKVVEWDAAVGCYYDRSTDLYMTIEEFNAHAGLDA